MSENVVRYLSLFLCRDRNIFIKRHWFSILLKDIGFQCAVSNEIDILRVVYHNDLYNDKMIIADIR